MLFNKQLITQLKSHQYGAVVATPFNSNTSAKRMKKEWVVIFAILITQKNVVAQQTQ
jgi:hypothetical protein